ncbi:MAG: DedA family protein [Hyphomicrobiaceae bacterium]
MADASGGFGFVDLVLQLVRENETLIEVILFSVALVESVIFTSMFVPSTLILVGIGVIEGTAAGPLLQLVLAAACGALAGDAISFAIGHTYRNRLGSLWPLSNHPALIERTYVFMAKWGVLAVVISKLTGPFRPVVPMLAGASRMPFHNFAAASAVSALIWAALFLGPAYYGVRAVAG